MDSNLCATTLLKRVLVPNARAQLCLTVVRLGDIVLQEDGMFHTLHQRETTLVVDLHVMDDAGRELLLALVGHAEAHKVVQSIGWRRA
jgi:hypothetical protein